jgi:hypothetical protein
VKIRSPTALCAALTVVLGTILPAFAQPAPQPSTLQIHVADIAIRWLRVLRVP